MAFIMVGTFLIAFPLLLWGTSNTGDLSAGTARKLFDKAALKDTAFWFYTWSNFFVGVPGPCDRTLHSFLQIFTGYMVPFFYIPSYAQLSLGTSRALALYSVVIAQASSIVGRMIFATLALHIGVMIPWVMCVSVSAILCLSWAGIHSTAAFCGFCALYGAFFPMQKYLPRFALTMIQASFLVPSFHFHPVSSLSSALTRRF